MTLEEFATEAGVTLIECEPCWGGTIGYKVKDHPNIVYCGFESNNAAYKHWLESTFGKTTATAVKKLLKQARPKLDSPEVLKKIRQLRLNGSTIQEIAEHFGMSQCYASNLTRRAIYGTKYA